MSKIIIFGLQDFAQLAHYYLTNDSAHEVVAFCVNKEYVGNVKLFEGKPVVAFEDVEQIYPQSDYKFFAPMSHKRMNQLRQLVYESIKSKGYEMISYVSTQAYVSNNQIGDNCFILENNTLQPFTNIGNNVVLWSGNHIGHHGIIEDHVFFTSHVVMSGHCHIKRNAFLGVNATLRDGIVVEEYSLIAMGAMLTKSTEPYGIYQGVPAKKADKSTKEIDI